MKMLITIELIYTELRYKDGIDNTDVENSSVFSLMQMTSARARGQ